MTRCMRRYLAAYFVRDYARAGRRDRAQHARLCRSGLSLGQCKPCRASCELELVQTRLIGAQYPFLRGIGRLGRITYRRWAYV